MNIIYIHKDRLAKRPPVISALLILNDLGHEVTLIDEEVSDYWKEELSKRCISFYETVTATNSGKIAKLLSYYHFRSRVYKTLDRIISNKNETIVWVEGAQTMVALGKKLNDYRHILQIQELHEKSKRQQKAVTQVIHSAEAVFMPEYCRTSIFQVWYGLKKKPITLPNKPYLLPDKEQCERVLARYEDVVNRLKNKRVILYQGGIKRIRLLDCIAKAIRKIGNNYHLLVLGTEQEVGVIDELKQITSEVTHIDFIPAPDYLAFCNLAHIGYVVYQPNSLNNVFCAPNKIFEYSAFNLPMLCNDIPGLKYPVEDNHAGVMIEPDNIESIVNGIKVIESDYEAYREGASRLYSSVDNVKTIKTILEKI